MLCGIPNSTNFVKYDNKNKHKLKQGLSLLVFMGRGMINWADMENAMYIT